MRATPPSFVLATVLFLAVLASSSPVHARSVADCKARWGSAVRSYLTKNRRAGPDGKVPTNLDEVEEAAQAWVEMFDRVCKLENAGRRREARLEAATLGTATLARLDMTACQRFLHYFMKAKDPEALCRSAGDDSAELQARLAAKLKHHRRLTVPWVSK